jgi:hypothetical protein
MVARLQQLFAGRKELTSRMKEELTEVQMEWDAGVSAAAKRTKTVTFSSKVCTHAVASFVFYNASHSCVKYLSLWRKRNIPNLMRSNTRCH